MLCMLPSHTQVSPSPILSNGSGSKRRILLVEDHPLTRRGLVACVNRTLHFEICAEASTGAEARELIPKFAPDIVILDISLPDANGIQLTKALQAEENCPLILIVSMYDDVLYAEWALQAGARGYVRK